LVKADDKGGFRQIQDLNLKIKQKIMHIAKPRIHKNAAI